MWAECDRIDTIFVTMFAFCPLDELTILSVPDADALVQASSGDELVVRRDGDGSDAILDLEGKYALVLLDIPQTDRAVTRAGCDVAPIGSEVEGVNVLVVTGELVANDFGGNIPDLNSTVSGWNDCADTIKHSP